MKRYPPINTWIAFELFGHVGISVALPLVAGAMIGAYLDSQWQTKPTATLIGLGIGFVVSLVSLKMTITRFLKRIKQEKTS